MARRAALLVFAAAIVITTLSAPAQAASAKPSVSSISPATGSTAGGTKVVVNGKHFTRNSKVYFGSFAARRVTYSSSKRLYAYSPNRTNTGTVSLRVKTTSGSSAITSRAKFTYKLPTNLGTDTLRPGRTMRTGQFITSAKSKYRLLMQSDGNLVVYEIATNKAKWNLGSQGSNRRAAMQTDGNFVVYDSADRVVYAAGTTGFDGAKLMIQDDGNLVVYRDGLPVWSNGDFLGDEFSNDQTMSTGAVRKSANLRFTLIMQGDGNLVLYDELTKKSVWSAASNGPGRRAAMQKDGNFVIYDAANKSVYATNTTGFTNAKMVVQGDGNLVIYRDGLAVWSKGTYLGDQLSNDQTLNPGSFRKSASLRYTLIMQGDGNLVMYDELTKNAVWSSATNGPNRRAVMQADGNFVIYDGFTPVWDTKTTGNAGAKIFVQDDANLVIYKDSKAVWTRFTSGRPEFKMPFPCRTSWSATTYDRGERISTGASYSHLNFLDFGQAGAANTSVLASRAGYARLTNSSEGQVTVDHGGGWTTVYQHMTGITVSSAGRQVGQGERLGVVGSGQVGTSTGPHLHYAQRLNGAAQSPTFAEGTYSWSAGRTATYGDYRFYNDRSSTNSVVSNNCG